MIDYFILIPCFNNEDTIKKNIRIVTKIFKRKKYKIFLINDGSNDATKKKFEQLCLRKNIFHFNFKINKGKSYVLKKSLKKIPRNFKYLIFWDSDIPYVSSIRKLLNEKKKLDLYAPNRFLEKSNVSYNNFYGFTRKIVSKIICIINSITLNSKEKIDSQSGFKLFKKNNILFKKKYISDFAFLDLEIMGNYIKRGLKIKFFPVKYKISNSSTFTIFAIKNFFILLEYIKVIFFLLKKK
jgi:hypothetical protein